MQISDERKETEILTEQTKNERDNNVIYPLINQNDNKKNRPPFNLPDLSLSSALGLLTPKSNNNSDGQPIKPLKKKKMWKKNLK